METSRPITLTFAAAAAAAAATVLLIALSFTPAAAVPVEYIRSSCKITQYPDLCEKSLADYATTMRRHSPRQLAHAALTVTATRAVSASNFVQRIWVGGNPARPPHGGAVRDCKETLGDCVERLHQSLKEMLRMGRYGSRSFRWHLSNVQTWVSASLTDQSTCLDSLAQDKSAAAVRPEISGLIVHVSRLTSNALCLINRLDPNNS